MGADELEEHQAYGDSTLGCNEATEQHSEQSDRARGAAWRGALPFRHVKWETLISNCSPHSLFFYRINLRFTTSLLSSLPLRISSLRSLTFTNLSGRALLNTLPINDTTSVSLNSQSTRRGNSSLSPPLLRGPLPTIFQPATTGAVVGLLHLPPNSPRRHLLRRATNLPMR
jgi:hypothetical protein